MQFDNNSRRQFLGSMVTGAAVTGLAVMPQILQAAAPVNPALVGGADTWLRKGLKGKHKVVLDGPEPHDAFPIIWTWAFYLTNNQTGVDDDEMTGVCVFRHHAIPFAMKDELWAEYKFGEMFNIRDNTTQEPALRNPYYQPKEGDFPVPVIDGIKKLQDRGAMFCVCDLAITVCSRTIAQERGLDPEAVKKEWIAGLLPGVQAVPSGVWALARAQTYGCGYIYAGG